MEDTEDKVKRISFKIFDAMMAQNGILDHNPSLYSYTKLMDFVRERVDKSERTIIDEFKLHLAYGDYAETPLDRLRLNL